MAQYNKPKKEKYVGTWNGEDVHFTREFHGKRFTDEECESLCRGETIRLEHLVSGKTNKKYSVSGKLAHQSFTNPEGETVNFIGFQPDWDTYDAEEVPDEFLGRPFSDEEKAQLLAGCTIHLKGLHSKKTGHDFEADAKWDITDRGGHGIILSFNHNR